MENDSNPIKEKLFSESVRKTYSSPAEYQDHLLEQYKIYLESSDRISSRRQAANSFFVTINTALIALVGYMNLGSNTSCELYWLVALAGMVLSYMWYRLIRSYRDLNTAKFKVVQEIEVRFPLSPFDAEWEAVGRGKDPKIYLPFINIEIRIPLIFLILYLFAFVRSFLWEVIKEMCITS